MTPAELRAIVESHVLVDAEVVAEALDSSKWAVYDARKRGDLGIGAIRVGRRLKFRTADLAALILGTDLPGNDAP